MKSNFTKLKQLALAMAFLFFTGMAFAQSGSVEMTQSFTTSGSWNVPAGVTEITIECIGGGGAGGYVHGKGVLFQLSGGGGGGAYAKKVVSVSGGQTVSVVVGAGGHAWATDGNQVHGGDSYATVGGSIVVRAAGGKTVKGENTTGGAAGGATDDCIGDTKYAGGKGGNGEAAALWFQEPGGGGGAAGSSGNGKNGATNAGGAATSNYGGKGADPKVIIGKGNTGGNYGGGGSGAECTGIGGEYGGDGANGYVIITYMTPPELDVNDMTAEICSGETFSVTPTGTIPTGTTYSWSAPSVTGITGTAAGSGASVVSGTLTSTNTANTDVVYNVTATSGSSYTDNFTVTVTVKGIITPGSITADIISCNAGDTSKIFSSNTDATGNGKYLWMKSTDNTTWTAIDNATNNTYTPIYMGNTGLTYYKRIFYSDCESVESNVLTLQYPGTVNPGQVKSADPKKYCYGSAVTTTLDTSKVYIQSGASVEIQWQESTDNGATWTNISGATSHEYAVNITSLTSDISYRYTIRLAGCDSIPANQWDFSTYALPVINTLTPSDTCPGLTSYEITADITAGDGAVTTYNWTVDATGTTNPGNITASLPNCGTTYNYSLTVTDDNGCTSEAKAGTFTTVSEPTPTFITETMGDFTSATCEFTIPNLKDTLEKAFKHDCSFISAYSQDVAAGTAMAHNATVSVTATISTVCGNTYNPTVDVKSDGGPALTYADVEFDDKNDTINLYYGICDTLYYVNTPNYDVTSSSPYAKGDLTLSNDKDASVNEGTLLGRMTGGEYTIIWKLTSPCGNYLEFPKKYVVMYPPCGGDVKATDADGIEYESVRIGCECWTKTNLRTVTGVTGNSYVYQDDPANETKFGRLYTWYSAVGLAEDATTDPATVTDPKTNKPYVQGICPAGWALPTADAYVNMVTTAGGVNNIKSSDASTWLPDIAGTDASGFGAVGAGYYTDQEFYYYNLLGEAYFWTCEGEPIYKKGTCCSITLTCPTLLINTVNAGRGLSVRCVKRNE